MTDEPRIALAASPREWAQRLHRYVVDHGGARVRATVLHPRDALDEDYDILVADDTTSFLTPRLVALLHERGRAVLGVFDPGEPGGEEELRGIGVDTVLPRNAPPESFVAALVAVLRHRPGPGDEAGGHDRPGAPPDAGASSPRGRLVAVAAAGGGAGATEIAVGLASACGRRGDATVLVDADDVSPSLAPRLRLPVYPNLRAAVDRVEQGDLALSDLLTPLHGGRCWALPGLSSAANWGDLRPAQTLEALRVLAAGRRQLLVNVGACIEDLPAPGTASRYGLARHVLAAAEAVVVVARPTPAGLARLFEWVAEFRRLAPQSPLHVVCNRAPSAAFKRAEVSGEVLRTLRPDGLWFVPADARVEAATWQQEVVAPGPFTRALVPIVAEVMPPARARRSARRRWGRAA